MKKYISLKAIWVPICAVLLMWGVFFLQKTDVLNPENLALIPPLNF